MAPKASKPPGEQPWSERHRPRHLGQVIGNIDQVRKLAEWLRDWDDVVLHGKKKEPPAEKKETWHKFQQAPENINARAALVSGPPGIGKTTTCSLVARCNPKYKVMEFNASDARGKTIIESMSQSLAGSHTLRFNAGGKSIERAVIIMDECDGMAGGGDKGGMQALINMIKNTKNPIICICNDRSDQQVRNLATHCFDIKFRRPDNLAVAKRIKTILEGEGKKVELSAVEAVVEACGQDMRQVINQVQFFGSLAVQGKSSQKDTQVMLSPFEACTRLFSGGRNGAKAMPMERRLDLYYIDADLMPLMVQENYLRPFDKRAPAADGSDLERCARAAELIATADALGGGWEAGSSAGVIGTVYPAFLTAGEEHFARPSFPAWLQKRAPHAKAERTVQELHASLKGSTTCSCKDLVTSSYHDVLYRRLLKPLQSGSIKECAAALSAYGLNRDFFTDKAPVLRQPLQMEDSYKKVDVKPKQSLLQELQSMAQQPAPKKRRAGEDEAGLAKRRSRAGEDTAAGAGDTGDADDDDETAEQADGGEDDSAGLFMKKKVTQKPGKAGKTAAKGTIKAGGVVSSKSSLAGWRSKPAVDKGVQDEGQHLGETPSKVQKPTLVLRYIEGHTCAVRRKVHIKDLLGPWLLF